MRKPLELTVHPFPTLEGDRPKDRLKHEFAKGAQRKQAKAKRFTDAELAAEYWQDYSNYVRECSNLLHCQERYMEAAGVSFNEAQQKCAVMYRFATLPHFDEVA